MRKWWIAIAMLLLVAVSVVAVENEQVEYIGGTVPSIKAGMIGQFELSSPSQLLF